MARAVSEGSPEPLGVVADARGVNIAVFSAHATAVEFCLFDTAGERELERIRLPERTGDVWHGHVADIGNGARYGLRVHGPYAPRQGHRFNPAKLLVDPYAQAIDRPYSLHPALLGYRDGDPFGEDKRDTTDSAPFVPKAIVGAPAEARATRRQIAWADTIIYELHVRGFTKRHPALPEPIRGTFAGLAHPRAIEHLVRLGVTAVEIMPAAAWIDERHLPRLGLSNYWGYNAVTMIAPDPRLAPGGWAEIGAAVDALHAAGIEAILDVVLNHSGESDELGATISFRGLDNASYYRLRPDDPGRYINDTGCGNCLALDRPPVVRMAMDSLRAWVRWTGIDGLRFDLATALGRRESGFDPAAPLLTAIGQDPLLRDLKLIAEPWDIGPGGYQVGAFPGEWAQWNDKFRDGVRRFWRGDGGRRGDLATRLAGSSDTLSPHARPSHNVNFVTAHDGFTLADLVAYTHKRNQANGEDNHDGTDDNISWNSGAEGPTEDASVRDRRLRDQRNLLATLLLARGTPMLAMGSELGQSQGGNNNAYAQDNEGSWIDWLRADADLARFAARIVAARQAHPALRQDRWLTGDIVDASGLPDVEWRAENGALLTGADWNAGRGDSLVATLSAPAPGGTDRVTIALNAGFDAITIPLPEPRDDHVWRIALDTASSGGSRAIAEDGSVEIAARSVVLFEETRSEAARRSPRKVDSATLDRLARAAGIGSEWWDEIGNHHAVSDETKRTLLATMGLAAGTVSQARESLARLTLGREKEVEPPAPARCYFPDSLRNGRRLFGLSAQLYAIRRPDDQGIGDFTTLAELADRTARCGGATVGFNPLHMLFPADRERASPYHPSDRRFLDPIYIDIAALGDLPGEASAPPSDLPADIVAYTRVWQFKRASVEARFAAFDTLARQLPGEPLAQAFGSFIAEGGETLHLFAAHEAIAETQAARTWPSWPAELRDPSSQAVRDFAAANEGRVRYHQFLQWLADRQFAVAARRGREAGLVLGFYRDLAVGAAPDGAEAWTNAAELARGAVVGSPPDRFSADGQVWNLTPPNPTAWRASNFRAFRELIAANMRHAGALRIDHVMGLARLFWMPEGARPADGAYVSYPLDALLTVLAEESNAHRCLVIGEDLGTVPEGLRDRLAASDILSYRVLWFEREGDGFKPPSNYPAKAVACVTTHDLPTLAGWWSGADLAERRALGQIGERQAAEAAPRRRAEKERLARHLVDAGLLTAIPDLDAAITTEFVVAALAWVADSPCALVLAQADDLAGETIATNLPGTDRERPNWRRRLPPAINALFDAELTRQVFARLLASRGD